MKHYGSPHRNLLRMAQVAVASAAFVMLAACGGGDDNNNASTLLAESNCRWCRLATACQIPARIRR